MDENQLDENPIEQIETDIEEIKADIIEIEKGLAITKAMTTLKAMPEFKLVFEENFVEAYRLTANTNIGLVRAEAVQGIINGLISRAHFENYVSDLVNSHDALIEQLEISKDQLKQLEDGLIEEKKLQAEANNA
jgi:hypothetical protein